MMKFTNYFSTKATPQSEPIPGAAQVANSAGGHVWALDDWARVDRFLVLGTEGGTYYVTERALTRGNAKAVATCIAADGGRVIARIVETSKTGRAANNDPAIFALAMCAKLGDDATRAAAYKALPLVCRTATHLMHFADYAQGFGGWGRGMRKAVANWFNNLPADQLAYQLVKYPSRDGWSNRDLLRLAHPRAASPSHDRLFSWVTQAALPEGAAADRALDLAVASEQVKAAVDCKAVVELIRTSKLPREAIPTQWLVYPEVWEALLVDMPMTAMIRNLATMTKVGLVSTMSTTTQTVVERLGDNARLAKARVHPIAVLAALVTYKAGISARGSATWTPVGDVVDALDGAFYASFKQLAPSGRRILLALDVSASMNGGSVSGVPGLSPRVASAAMALVTAATEPNHAIVAFSEALTPLAVSPRQRLDDVVRATDALPFGGTDCSQPMVWAERNRVDVDTFVIYTDNETWAGSVHPAQALRAYRQACGRPAKLVVVGMTSNGFSIADPNDAGMLDVVGFDTATPSVIRDFAQA